MLNDKRNSPMLYAATLSYAANDIKCVALCWHADLHNIQVLHNVQNLTTFSYLTPCSILNILFNILRCVRKLYCIQNPILYPEVTLCLTSYS